MKIKINTAIALFIFVLATVACTDKYGDINRDPYEIDDEEASRDGYNISSKMRTLQFNVIPVDAGRCQYTDLLLGGAYGRYVSESKANAWPNKFSTFDAPDSWSGVMFNEVIPQIYPAYNELKNVTDDVVALSIAEILKVMAMQRVTDVYGPIPYSKIGVDGAIQAPYDSQKDIYMKMFEELDSAIEQLTERQTQSISPNTDLIYGGDLMRWIKLANSIKLRMAMRIVYAEPTIAKTRAEEAVSHSIGVMTSNADNAVLKTFGVDGNPLNVAIKFNAGDHRSVADMTAYMNAYGDPRRAAYFEPSGFTGVDYSGYRSGISIGGESEFIKYSLIKISRDTPLQWMNAAEVAFLKSEGALRGWNMGGESAKTLYEQAVALSFEQWGVTGVDTYLANNTGTPNGYTDPVGTYTYSSRLTDVTVMWDETAAFEKKLERIIVQKWLANYLLGHEAWADRRRTGYPRMIPVVVNNSQGLLTDDATPRRMPYPAQEAVTNKKNYDEALVMLRGSDNIATRLWWDCNPNN